MIHMLNQTELVYHTLDPEEHPTNYVMEIYELVIHALGQ